MFVACRCKEKPLDGVEIDHKRVLGLCSGCCLCQLERRWRETVHGHIVDKPVSLLSFLFFSCFPSLSHWKMVKKKMQSRRKIAFPLTCITTTKIQWAHVNAMLDAKQVSQEIHGVLRARMHIESVKACAGTNKLSWTWPAELAQRFWQTRCMKNCCLPFLSTLRFVSSLHGRQGLLFSLHRPLLWGNPRCDPGWPVLVFCIPVCGLLSCLHEDLLR